VTDFKWKNDTARNIFYQKYALTQSDSWPERCRLIVDDVCGTMGGRRRRTLSKSECDYLTQLMIEMKFLPGGRYIYYAGRRAHYFNNCFCLKAEEDTREEWAALAQRATSCLMVGGGIGVDYSVIRPKGRSIGRTGGTASGSLSLMEMINEIGRNVMQGGSRRSAIYSSLNWKHGDAWEFLGSKDWNNMKVKGTDLSVGDLKRADFNYRAPLDMTNISLNYDDSFLEAETLPDIFLHNVRSALMNGEPGMSFNFGDKSNETLRNACCEITSEDDSDVCNLGAINLGAVESIEEFESIVDVASKFLVCGTLRADLPYEKVSIVREKNRRLGLGLMGVHEWLLKRGHSYQMTDDLRDWMEVYKRKSESSANEHCDRLYLNRPAGYRAIAPTGTIGLIAATTTGIEPVYSVAYKRRYLVNGDDWKYEYVVDNTAKQLIEDYSLDPNSIETAVDLAKDYKRRISFQADMQDYIDHAISSTINLPPWGSEGNNEDLVIPFAETLAEYAPRLRGFTCYPDGGRGGQPITSVPYEEAMDNVGQVFTESHDICEISGKGGSCGS
jgi:ribonucleoside-diphosphate reductase alpha chain